MTKAEQSLSRDRTVLLIGATTLSTCAWVSMPGGPSLRVTHSMVGPPAMRNGSMARSMPSVTACVELGLMTRMRSEDAMPQGWPLNCYSTMADLTSAAGEIRKG